MSLFNRREFIGTASGAALSPLVPNTMSTAKTGRVVHHVFFWLKNSGSAEDAKMLMTGLKTLTAISEIKELQIGIPASTEKRDVVDNSYDISELMYFENAKDQDAYQVHEVHKAFVAKYSHLWSKVVVYDMIVQ